MPASLPSNAVPHTLRRPLKWLVLFVLGCYIVLATIFLGVRYWFLPNIDRWREPIQERISAMLSVQVQLGEIGADWRGLRPRLHVRDAVLHDDAGRPLLNVPSMDAVLSWRSVLSGRPQLYSLHAEGVRLSVRRDRANRIHILGREVDPGLGNGGDEGAAGEQLLHWIAGLEQLHLSHATLRWIDVRRAAPPLEFRDVSIRLASSDDGYGFAMVAKPPGSLGQSFTLQAAVRSDISFDRPASLEEISGLLHVNVPAMQPSAWQPWLDVHTVLDDGRVNWQGWQEVESGALGRHVSHVEVERGRWRPSSDVSAAVRHALVYLDGPWRTLHALWSAEANEDATLPPARVVVKLQASETELPSILDEPLAFDEVAVSAHVNHDPDNGFLLDVERAQLRNADMDLDVLGTWRQRGGGVAGLIDMSGHFQRAELAAIERYLPRVVDQDAREWMRNGLLAGRLTQAPVILRGDLVHFPFGEQPDSGEFSVGGPVSDVVIDYAPEALAGPPGWPRLEQLNGHASLHNVHLTVKADSMQMRPREGASIALTEVEAHIPDIEDDAQLTVKGLGKADGGSFLALIQESPLDELLDGLFADATASGTWEVPISLDIPLTDTAATRVAGSVIFRDGGLMLDKSYPALSRLEGKLDFTEEVLVAHGIKGMALDGPVEISGGVGPGQKSLVFNGRLTAAALDRYLDGRLHGRAKGSTAYRLDLQRNGAGGFGLRFDAPLDGLALDLPAPLAKPAAQRQALRVQWTPAKGKNGSAALDINLAGGPAARLLHRMGGGGKAPFFHAAAVSWGAQDKPKTDGDGLTVDIVAPTIDIDGWRELMADTKGAKGLGNAAGLLPPLRSARLQADTVRAFGMDLDHFTFTARKPESDHWRVDVSSTQTAGTLFWHQRQGKVQGNVQANFERLMLGNPSSDKGEPEGEPDISDDIDIPAVQLHVDRLKLYGRDVGSVSLIGVNTAQGRSWKLQELQISSPHGVLKGTGHWQLRGPQRGLRIEANAMFDDLGAWLAQAGFKDLVHGGHGEVKGHIEWRDIPWRFDRAQLYGDLTADLAKGRFASLGSHSGRLLELLSLQSVKRLATFEWNPAGLMQQGFPFDTLQGHVSLKAGVLHSENYRITSPVATIVMAGDVDLVQEKLDVHAVVVPSLDVSGAAIAAGIAVNPVVGIGAFLTQWLLKHPLSKAMTVEYRVKGKFDDPQIAEVQRSEGGG